MTGPQYGRINLAVSAILPDAEDPDALPERVPLDGSAMCVPRIDPGFGNVGLDPEEDQEVQLPLPVPCEIVDGVLSHGGRPHVTLLVPTGGWEWEIIFDLLSVDERPLVLEPFRFPVIEHTAAELADDNFAGVNIAQFAAEQYRNATPGAVSEYNIMQMLEIQATVRQSADEAEDQAQAAAGSAAEALSYRNSAQGHASNATAKATAADQARDAAVVAQGLAEAAQAAAEAARDAAQTARTDAEGARDAAQAAGAVAQSAAATATTKAGEASTSASQAAGFRDTAAGHASAAGTARSGAETARAAAEAARDAAVAAKVEWRGPWAAGTAYTTRDAVSHGGSSWWALRPSTGVTPVEGADWSLLAAKGEQGDANVGDATETTKGAVALAGNLSGTADAPVVKATFTPGGSPEPVTVTFDDFASDMSQVVGEMYYGLSNLSASLVIKADLDENGKLAAAQLPALAVVEFLGTVASQAGMLALTGQKGDWCIRTDTSTTWIITGDDPAQVSSWTQLVHPADAVSSVAGRTGAVTLSKADVGLSNVDNTSDANKPISTAVSQALGNKAASDHSHTPASLGAVARSGTAVTLWSGTAAQYAALSTATKNAAGFVAIIS